MTVPVPPAFLSVNDVEWIRDQCKRHTYKPWWEVYVPANDTHVLFVFRAHDARKRGETIDICMRQYVPMGIVWQRNTDSFTDWLAACIKEMEIHESREWLQRDGVIWDDPHAGKIKPTKE